MGRADDRRCVRCHAILRRANPSDLCSPCARVAGQAVVSLPNDFHARPDIVSALSTYEFGPFFKAARAELGLTQEEFGLLVGLAQSRVCKVENGALRLRDIETIAHLVSILGTPPDLLGFVADAATLDESR